MRYAAILQLSVPGPVGCPALRRLREATRELARQEGFQCLRAFRGVKATDAVIFVSEWNRARDARQAIGSLPIDDLRAAAAGAGIAWQDPQTLGSGYERCLSDEPATASLLRLATNQGGDAATIQERDREQSLRALGAPGTLRASGARNRATTLTICRVDFDSEDALWAYLDSEQKAEWDSAAQAGGEAVIWALDLPRFACFQPTPATTSPAAETESERFGPLSIELERTPPPGGATLICRGRLDEAGARRCASVIQSLANEGHGRVMMNIAGLTKIEPAALRLLTRCAHRLRAQEVEFGIQDNPDRTQAVVRRGQLPIPRPRGQQRGRKRLP